MTDAGARPVLVTGATGRVGHVVIDLLVDAGVPIRALTHRSEAAGAMPATVEVVVGDLTDPGSLDAALRGVLAAGGATIGTPASVTSTVGDLLGSPARTFREWVTDHASELLEAPDR